MKTFARKHTLLFFMLLCVAANGLFGQKSMEASRLDTPPVIDGVFEESIWQGASPATGFVQMAPSPGEASGGDGLCYMGFDDRAIYLSVRLFQDEDGVFGNPLQNQETQEDSSDSSRKDLAEVDSTRENQK